MRLTSPAPSRPSWRTPRWRAPWPGEVAPRSNRATPGQRSPRPCARRIGAHDDPDRQRRAPRMKILICSNFFPPEAIGGAELVAFEHGKVLRDRGHEVRVFRGRMGGGSPWWPSRVAARRGEFPQTIVGLGPRDISGDTWNFANPSVERVFRELLVDFAPDVVHFHNLV